MKHGLRHFFIVIVVAILFLLYATIGYGAYSDSLSLRGWVSVILPATADSSEDISLANPEAACPPEGAIPLVTPGPEDEIRVELPVDSSVTAEPSAWPEESPIPQETASAPAEEELKAKVSISKTIFTVGGSYAGQLTPYFSSVYTDRSGSLLRKEEKPAYHWDKNTLVAYGSVFVEQNGLPGSAILADMSIHMGAAIRFDNTTGSDILLTRTSASGAIEHSFCNDTDGTLSDTSVRLLPGQTGVISAYLDHGWQLNASELDLENQPGMSCAREFKLSFQTENLKTGERRTYAILLVAQVITQAPAPTPAPTETIMPIDEAGSATPTPYPTEEASPVPTMVPAVELTPEPPLDPTPEPRPDPTQEPAPTENIEPTAALESEPTATLEQPAALELTPEPEIQVQELPPETAPPSMETAVPEAAAAQEPPSEPIAVPQEASNLEAEVLDSQATE